MAGDRLEGGLAYHHRVAPGGLVVNSATGHSRRFPLPFTTGYLPCKWPVKNYHKNVPWTAEI